MKLTTHFALHFRGTWLWECTPYTEDSRWHKGFSPTVMFFSKKLTSAPLLVVPLEATTQDQGPNFHAKPIPVHSPLLRESCLVYFPPLTYMLKFSGFSDLTSCHWKVIKQAPTQSTGANQFGLQHVTLEPAHWIVCDRNYLLTHRNAQDNQIALTLY